MPDLSDKVSERPDGVPDDVWEMAGKALGSPSFNRDTIRVRIANAIMADRRARPAASTMEGWRTMDSAPKDGRINRVIGYWPDDHGEPRVDVMHLFGDEKHPYWKSWGMEEVNGVYWMRKNQPTLWQPLPAAPIPPEVMK